jgi:hypothetical protein
MQKEQKKISKINSDEASKSIFILENFHLSIRRNQRAVKKTIRAQS